MKSRDAAVFLRAFGDPTRLRIVGALAQQALRVSQLQDLLKAPQPRVTRHLQYLEARGVVTSEPLVDMGAYRLAPPAHELHKRVLAAIQAVASDIEDIAQDSLQLPHKK